MHITPYHNQSHIGDYNQVKINKGGLILTRINWNQKGLAQRRKARKENNEKTFI